MGTNTSMSKVIHSTSIMKVNHKSITMRHKYMVFTPSSLNNERKMNDALYSLSYDYVFNEDHFTFFVKDEAEANAIKDHIESLDNSPSGDWQYDDVNPWDGEVNETVSCHQF